MDITLHKVKSITVKDSVHENEQRNDGGFSVRTIVITRENNDGTSNKVEVKLFSEGLTPAKLNI